MLTATRRGALSTASDTIVECCWTLPYISYRRQPIASFVEWIPRRKWGRTFWTTANTIDWMMGWREKWIETRTAMTMIARWWEPRKLSSSVGFNHSSWGIQLHYFIGQVTGRDKYRQGVRERKGTAKGPPADPTVKETSRFVAASCFGRWRIIYTLFVPDCSGCYVRIRSLLCVEWIGVDSKWKNGGQWRRTIYQIIQRPFD